MGNLAKKLLMCGGRQEDKLYVDDVFSTYVYEGTGAAQDIVNGINLADEGGMVWIKGRPYASNNVLMDTERPITSTTGSLYSNSSAAEMSALTTLTSFNSDGYTLGRTGDVSSSGDDFVSWTFRKAPRFFDVVKFISSGTNPQVLSHDLGVPPGMMIVKKISNASNWSVYHRSLGNTQFCLLDTALASGTDTGAWNNTSPTDSEFTVGASITINNAGDEYIAYLFAHDPLGENGNDGMIACGSFTIATTDVRQQVDLGWEPQYVLVKQTNGVDDWKLSDSIRGMPTGDNAQYLRPNTADMEGTTDSIELYAKGFSYKTDAGKEFIYMAIRRPNKPPESADEVFAIDTKGSVGDGKAPAFRSGFPVDMGIETYHAAVTQRSIACRLTAGRRMYTDSAQVQVYSAIHAFFYNNGWYNNTATSVDYISYMWKRSPEFFDVVCYDGDGVAGSEVSHGLQVEPEMIWVKCRTLARHWGVYHVTVGKDKYAQLDQIYEFQSYSMWNNTTPTDTVFTVGAGASGIENAIGEKYIAYLFATLPGISKVGSYTGNGSTQTIDCGFATGARFILIKRTDAAGDWYIWDTLRGIISANDPHLSLNTTDAQVTTDDSVDPDASGFIVNQNTATNINVLNGKYIFYAIA